MKYDSLTSWELCGCLRRAVVIADDTKDLQRSLLRQAKRRGLSTKIIPAGDEMPPWECEGHRMVRLARMAAKENMEHKA